MRSKPSSNHYTALSSAGLVLPAWWQLPPAELFLPFTISTYTEKDAMTCNYRILCIINLFPVKYPIIHLQDIEIMSATLHYISKWRCLKYLSRSQGTNFCLRQPGTECRLLWKGEGREGVQKNTNGGGGGGGGGLGKQTTMMMMKKRIMTQGRKGRKIMMMMIIINEEAAEISNRHGRCRNSMC